MLRLAWKLSPIPHTITAQSKAVVYTRHFDNWYNLAVNGASSKPLEERGRVARLERRKLIVCLQCYDWAPYNTTPASSSNDT